MHMRRLMLSVLLAATAAAPVLAAERSFPTGQFDRVSNTTPFDVYVHTGKAPGAHAVGSADALDKLLIENRGGELRIGTKPGRWFSGWHWGRGQNARIDVTVPMIIAANLSGPGNLNVDAVRTRAFTTNLSGPGDIAIGLVEAGDLDVHLSGPGDITLAGHAGTARLSLSGPGNIHAAKLALSDATVSVSGPGDVDATVARTADVRLSGPGDVRIRGGAHCAIHKSGPGDVTCG
jgi:hypothetical protein